jgi:hypothetical protein
MIRRWLESKLMIEKQLVQIMKPNANLVDLEWSEQEQANYMTQAARYTIHDVEGASRVDRQWLPCIKLVLRDPVIYYEISG